MVTGITGRSGRCGKLAAALVLCLLGGSAPLAARTYVVPHMLEKSGRITDTQFTFDTTIYATYTPGLAGTEEGQGAEVSLYLYDPATDQPLLSAKRAEVCNPCTASLDASTRKVAFAMDDLIEAAGGSEQEALAGYGVIVVGGADPDNVALQGFVVSSHTSPSDLSVFGFEPQPLAAESREPGAPPSPRRVFVLPHVLEASGRIADTQYTFDTQMFMTYTPGLAGTPGGGGATVDFYLLDDATGEPMVSATGEAVCNPCTFDLGPGGQGSASRRKQSIRMDDLITAKGGFKSNVKLGFGVLVVGGQDPDGVNLQGFVVNSHTSPFDVSATITVPQELTSSSRDPKDPPPSPRRTFVLPHVLEVSGRITDTQFTFDTTIFATYTAGLAGMQEGPGATVDVYLHDASTGEVLRDRNGGIVCNPCTRTLGAGDPGTPAARKVGFSIDAELAEGLHQVGAVIDVSGDHENVALQGFVVNSHTSPFDLSIAAIEPQAVPQSHPGEPSGDPKRTFVLPHVLEASGTIQNSKVALDMSITATYAPDAASPAGSPDATVELHLFDESTGSYMKSLTGQDVCAPCTVTLGLGRRSATLDLEALAEGAGGLASPVVLGYGIVVVPSDQVALQGFVVNSHSGPFDLSVFGFEPQPIAAPARIAGPRFLRGDSNADAAVDIGDPINTLAFLFQGTATPRCLKSADADGRTGVDISDAVYLLQFLFLGGPAPIAPFPACGPETETTELGCDDYPQCS